MTRRTKPAPVPSGRRRRPTTVAIVAFGALAAITMAGCGEATARSIQVQNSSMTFVLPAEFSDLGQSNGDGEAYGLPGSSLVEPTSQPVLFATAVKAGDGASFKSLREVATRGQFDPLDPSLTTLPDNTAVLGYGEIIQPDVWGIRLQLTVGSSAKDFQALVDRATDEVVISEVVCTQACYLNQRDVIEDIQGSWRLET